MLKSKIQAILIAVSLCCGFSGKAQSGDAAWAANVLTRDSLFWQAYNNCAAEYSRQFFTEDLEMYHDVGGVTLGAADMVNSLKNNLCSRPDWRLRREAVSASIQLYPLYKNNIIYGAVLMGDHKFYITENEKKEYHSGNAKFTSLWILEEGVWKMKRLLSFDHRPAPYQTDKVQIELKPSILKAYEGTYIGPQAGPIVINRNAHFLKMTVRGKDSEVFPTAKNLFFSKERDLEFEFVKNNADRVEKMIIRESGKTVEVAMRQ